MIPEIKIWLEVEIDRVETWRKVYRQLGREHAEVVMLLGRVSDSMCDLLDELTGDSKLSMEEEESRHGV